MEKNQIKELEETLRYVIGRMITVRRECKAIEDSLRKEYDAMTPDAALSNDGINVWIAAGGAGSACARLGDAIHSVEMAIRNMETAGQMVVHTEAEPDA